jgi:Protein of unknown function (DUF2589)
MSTKLGGLISGMKKAVIDAHRSVSKQHMEEIEHFFQLAPDQDPTLVFPNGKWIARTVTVIVPKEVSNNGKVAMENHEVMVPLITLLPLKSHTLERVEILTSLDFSLADLSDDVLNGKANIPPEVRVNLGSNGPNTAEIKIFIVASEPPDGYARLVGAYDKLLNAQLPN